MRMKYYEKVIIAIVIFLGVSIATGYIIGCYANTKKEQSKNDPNRIIIENINLF